MIKRLKWNSLYGGGGGEESDDVTSSSMEESADEDEQEERARRDYALLQMLAEHDPEIAKLRKRNEEAAASSSDTDDDEPTAQRANGATKRAQESSSHYENESDPVSDIVKGESVERRMNGGGKNNAEQQDSGEGDVDPDAEYAEWRECNLCPGKRFLNDNEVDAHLKSKLHLRKAAQFEKALAAHEVGEDSVKTNDGTPAQSTAEDRKAKGTKATHSLQRRGSVAEEKQKPASGGKKPSEEKLQTKVAKFGQDTREPTLSARQNGTGDRSDAAELLQKERRKARAKRKLKALKKRKWEKHVQAEKLAKEQLEIDEKPSGLQSEHAKTNGPASRKSLQTPKRLELAGDTAQMRQASRRTLKPSLPDKVKAENMEEGRVPKRNRATFKERSSKKEEVRRTEKVVRKEKVSRKKKFAKREIVPKKEKLSKKEKARTQENALMAASEEVLQHSGVEDPVVCSFAETKVKAEVKKKRKAEKVASLEALPEKRLKTREDAGLGKTPPSQLKKVKKRR